ESASLTYLRSAAPRHPLVDSRGPEEEGYGVRKITCRVAIGALAFVGACKNPEFATEPPRDAGPPMPPPMPVNAGPPAPPPPGDGVGASARGAGRQGRRAAEAPGMKPEGPLVCAKVAEGQAVTSATFVLEPGYCYTFLGEGFPPVSEVDMQL